MQNAGLDYSQAGNKIAGRNINNLWYADDNTLTAESVKEVKRPLMRMKKGSEKAGLKFYIQKIKTIASGPITLRQIEGEKSRSNDKLFFLGTPKSLQMVTAAMKLKDACSLEENLWQT